MKPLLCTSFGNKKSNTIAQGCLTERFSNLFLPIPLYLFSLYFKKIYGKQSFKNAKAFSEVI